MDVVLLAIELDGNSPAFDGVGVGSQEVVTVTVTVTVDVDEHSQSVGDGTVSFPVLSDGVSPLYTEGADVGVTSLEGGVDVAVNEGLLVLILVLVGVVSLFCVLENALSDGERQKAPPPILLQRVPSKHL